MALLKKSDLIYVLSQLVGSIDEYPDDRGILDGTYDGVELPIEQTIRVPVIPRWRTEDEGPADPDEPEFKFVQVIFLEADQALFDRQES